MSAATLEGRLLAAANLTYSIAGAPATVPPSAQGYEALAGLPVGAKCFVGGDDDIDAVLVGTSADGVVVAFRGTLPPLPLPPDPGPVIRDWVQDFECEPIHERWAMGLVHKGFALALETLWTGLCAEVGQSLKANPAARLLVTGHSKGGSMAFLAAARFVDANIVTADRLCVRTFEAAHPGDPTFAQWFDARKVDAARYEYGNDIVPHLAPSVAFRGLHVDAGLFESRLQSTGVLWDYASPGELRYIDKQLHITVQKPESILSRTARFVAITECIVDGRAAELAKDHAIGKGSAVWSAVAG